MHVSIVLLHTAVVQLAFALLRVKDAAMVGWGIMMEQADRWRDG